RLPLRWWPRPRSAAPSCRSFSRDDRHPSSGVTAPKRQCGKLTFANSAVGAFGEAVCAAATLSGLLGPGFSYVLWALPKFASEKPSAAPAGVVVDEPPPLVTGHGMWIGEKA